jgi:CcmD family protein
MKTLSFLLLLMLAFVPVFAQQTNDVEMADVLRSSGKIYVVVTIIAVVFIGLAIYLFSIDRRLKKLEK